MTLVDIGVRFRSEVGFNKFWLSLFAMDKFASARLIPGEGYGAVQSAQHIFREFLKGEASHLLMLDDDAVLAKETISRLLSRNLPVIGALTWTRGLPPAPTVYRGFLGVSQGKYPSWGVRHDDVQAWFQDPRVKPFIIEHQQQAAFVLPYDGLDMLSRVDAVGLHCLLLRRDVLERIGEPYLEGSDMGIREDFDFSERCAKAGYDLYVDKSVVCGHIAVHPIRPLDYYVYAMAMEIDAKAQEH